MTYFNMIKIIESTSIGVVQGLKFYGSGQLDIEQMVTYVEVKDKDTFSGFFKKKLGKHKWYL